METIKTKVEKLGDEARSFSDFADQCEYVMQHIESMKCADSWDVFTHHRNRTKSLLNDLVIDIPQIPIVLQGLAREIREDLTKEWLSIYRDFGSPVEIEE